MQLQWVPGMLLRWAILNIVSGNAHQTQAIVDLDAVPILLRILKESPSEDVQDQAARRWLQMLDWGVKPDPGDKRYASEFLPTQRLRPLKHVHRNPWPIRQHFLVPIFCHLKAH